MFVYLFAKEFKNILIQESKNPSDTFRAAVDKKFWDTLRNCTIILHSDSYTLYNQERIHYSSKIDQIS